MILIATDREHALGDNTTKNYIREAQRDFGEREDRKRNLVEINMKRLEERLM
jgi:hypothetical protein